MSTFKDYLTESTKSYDYKIKIAGDSKDIDKNALETALQKFDLAKICIPPMGNRYFWIRAFRATLKFNAKH